MHWSRLKRRRNHHIDISSTINSKPDIRDAMGEINAFFTRLNFRIRKFIYSLFHRAEPPAANNIEKPESSNSDDLNPEIGENQSEPYGPYRIEYEYSEKSMTVKTRIVDAAPPVGYLKILQVLRRQV